MNNIQESLPYAKAAKDFYTKKKFMESEDIEVLKNG